MTDILTQGPTGDGYDVRFIAANGQAYVLHWLSAPDAGEVAAGMAAFEARLAAEDERAYVIEAEDGTEV